jgi:hypothetical protein
MRTVTKQLLLVCTSLTALAFASCNAIADTSGLTLSPDTVWIRLVPSVAVGGKATLVLDFSKPVDGLTNETSATDLATLFTFKNSEGMSGVKKITVASITKDSDAVYRLTVEHVPDVEKGIVLVAINKSGIAPPTRAWSLDGELVLDEPTWASAPSIALTPGYSQLGYTITASDPAADWYDIYYIEGSETLLAVVKSSVTMITGAASPTGTIPNLTNELVYSVIVTAHKSGYADADSAIVQRTPAYQIGDPGPAGGWIFYDKGEFSDGWRYLEAAPEDLAGTYAWGVYPDEVLGTNTGIGTGKVNTQLIVEKYSDGSYAANLCAALEIINNGTTYDDWFLPSKEELNLMWTKLKVENGVNFSNNFYWSSSENYTYWSWYQGFSYGDQGYASKNYTHSARAVRAF